MSKTTMIQHTGEGGPVRVRTDEPDKAATEVKMNVPIAKFLDKFNEIYNELYEAGDNVAGFNEAVGFFDEFTKQHQEFVGEFVKFRGDFISSDREAASFAYTLEEYNLI